MKRSVNICPADNGWIVRLDRSRSDPLGEREWGTGSTWVFRNVRELTEGIGDIISPPVLPPGIQGGPGGAKVEKE